ncbi:putative 26S proteasome regulatory subunit [Entophlyctis sp. JEL0112]|nr:putative 26S proteasome regulatory subunit [Entophlyctis sp. JEL0112]
MSFDALRAEVVAAHGRISALKSVSPSPEADAAFASLVALCIQPPSSFNFDTYDEVARFVEEDSVLQPLVPQLLSFYSSRQSAIEFEHVRNFLAAEDPAAALVAFPTHRNYKDLTASELTTLCMAAGVPIDAAASKFAKVLFVGSGPLPISAVMLARGPLSASHFTCMDLDADANALAALLTAQCCGGTEFEFVTTDVASLEPRVTAAIANADAVFMAAMVGITREDKRRNLLRITGAMKEGAVLLARSARGLRTLLYPAIEDGTVAASGMRVASVFHPENYVINSTIVMVKEA